MAGLQAQTNYWTRMLNAYFANGHKLALSNVAIVAGDDYADITEIASGNGYSTGGITVTPTIDAPSATTGRVAFADVTLTASGGAIATFRYGLIYDTVTGDAKYRIDWGSAQSLADGESRDFDFDAAAYVVGT